MVMASSRLQSLTAILLRYFNHRIGIHAYVGDFDELSNVKVVSHSQATINR